METIKKKCKVVMLPTNSVTSIFKITDRKDFDLIFCDIAKANKYYQARSNKTNYRDGIFHHIYITSNQEIQIGDWYYSDCFKEIYKATKLPLALKDAKKIVSSDDLSLNLPAPSLSFLEKYCKSNGTINEVMVEFSKTGKHTIGGKDTYLPVIKWEIGKQKVVITKIKTQWDREEVENLVRLAMQSKGYTPEFEVQEFNKKHLD